MKKFLLNLSYFAYIKINAVLYRFIMYISKRNPAYADLINDLALHNSDLILNNDRIEKFSYKILDHVPNRYLNISIDTSNTTVDIIFLIRLYKTVINVPEFVNIGTVKMVLICTYGSDIFTLAKSFPIKPTTTPQEFVLHFFKGFVNLTIKGYPVEGFEVLLVKTTLGDRLTLDKNSPTLNNVKPSSPLKTNQKRSYSTSRSTIADPSLEFIDNDFMADTVRRDPRRYIMPLQGKEKQNTKIAVFDIETFVVPDPNNSHKGKLYPYAIALQYIKYNKTRKIIFYYESIHPSIEDNCKHMMQLMVDYIERNCVGYTLFAHNLGKFDAIFIIPSLYKLLGSHSIMFGKDNRIISIKFKRIKMLDSLRIFPMSLRKLAKQFEVPTQKGVLDHSQININNLQTKAIKDLVLKYLEADISSLFECMIKASENVFNKYKVNITDVYSASSLAMKHYRISYLDNEGIPLIPKHLKDDIRNSYFGGISQVYKTYGKNLKYYDINSLYPWAMTQDMPYEYLGVAYNPKLENIFGFAYASIYVPPSIKYKPLPVRLLDDSLATPSGHILGTYFSEELKYAASLGCYVKIHKAFLYSRKQLFNKYVEDLYLEKKVATGSNRVFIKLLLNGLYGFFARNEDNYISLFLPLDEAIQQAQVYPSYNIIVTSDYQHAFLIRDVEPSKQLCEATNNKYTDFLTTMDKNRIKSNRAIASAITAYSRVRIHQFKVICGDVYYSDTDSIITGNTLSDQYINDELGMMKDECIGLNIDEGIFISSKFYGLKMSDGTTKIVVRGIPTKESDTKLLFKGETEERSINFNDIVKVYNGEPIEYTRKQLFKSINYLTMEEQIIKTKMDRVIPTGKKPIYENDKIVGYDDIHRSVLTAIKETPINMLIRSRVRRIIDEYNSR